MSSTRTDLTKFAWLSIAAALVTIALKTGDALLVPGVFGLATALPVILVSFLLASGVGQVARLMQRAQAVDFWVKKAVAVVFIGVGCYLVWIAWVM